MYWVFDSGKFRLHSRLIVSPFLGVSVLVQKLLQGRWKDTGMILKAGGDQGQRNDETILVEAG